MRRPPTLLAVMARLAVPAAVRALALGLGGLARSGRPLLAGRGRGGARTYAGRSMRVRLTLALVQGGFAALVAVCALVPIVFTRSSAEAFMVPKVTVLWLGTVLAVAGVVAWSVAARRSPLPRLRIALPLGVLVVLTTVATVFSTSPVTSFFGRYGRYDGLLGLLVPLLLGGAVVAYCWRAPQRLIWIAGALVLSGVVGLGHVTIQQFGWDWIEWLDETGAPIPRPYGLLGNSNFSGAHLAIVIPLVLAFRTRVDGLVRLGLLALAGLLALGVWWTGTRGGALAAVGGVAALGFLAPTALPRIVRWGTLALTVIGLAVVVVSATADSIPGGDLVSGVRFTGTATLDTRVEIWGAAAEMVRDHPILGVGPDTFHLAYPEYRSLAAADNLVINADEAHDVFLDRAATSGIPAVLAYLWFLGLLALYVVRSRRVLEESHRWLLAGFGGALAAYVLQGLVSIDVVPVALLGWVSAAALVALADPAAIAGRTGERVPERLRPLSPVALGGFAVVVVVLGLLAVRPLVADLRFRDGLEDTAAGRPLAVGAADFEAAIEWFGAEPRYHARFADQLVAIATTEVADDEVRRQLLNEALVAYHRALDRDPGAIATVRAQARAEVALAAVAGPEHLEVADGLYRSLIDRVDTDWQLYAEHGTLLVNWASVLDGQQAEVLRAEAVTELERSVDLFDGSVDTLGLLAQLYREDGRRDEARELLEQAVDLEPERQDLQNALQELEEASGG